MARLIAFDQQTASTLVARTRTAAQLGHGSPLKAALAVEEEATLMMPSANRDQVLIVSVRRPAKRTAVAVPKAVRTRPAAAKAPVSPTAGTPPQAAPAPLAKVARPAPLRSAAKKPVEDLEPVAFEATGLLGLGNSPVYQHDLDEEARRAKRKWWQKLLD